MSRSRNATFALALSLFVSPIFAACSSGLGDATGATCPPSSTLTYENFGKDFMDKNCNSCHGAGAAESPKLDTVASIRSNIGDIDKAAAKGPNATNTFMPEGRSVSDEDRTKLGEWLACGAK